jgi:dephospho-CoA kinase
MKKKLIVLAGGSGVGKTTTLNMLEKELKYGVLAGRRDITNKFIIPTIQKKLGEEERGVSDREERFRLTRIFSKFDKRGIIAGLSALLSSKEKENYLFDGIRSVDEYKSLREFFQDYEVKVYMLYAKDEVRMRRIAARGDVFDQIEEGDLAKAQEILANESLNYDLKDLKNYILEKSRDWVINTEENSPKEVIQFILNTINE